MTEMSTHDPAAGVAARRLPRAELLRLHELMVEGRGLEERLIRMQRQGEGYFWIGGPGEEAFNASLGLLVKKGRGLDHDFLHLHYRSSATLLAMGAPSIDALRQMANRTTDPYSRGRNFVGHFSKREWNVIPVTSPIEVQYAIAIGTGLAQRRSGCTGLTVVQGGDAGSAEGEFASCLIWASRPGAELPMLIVVANNAYGISTPAHTQHGEKRIVDRGIAFGIRAFTCDGNDAEDSYLTLREALDYVRSERRPAILECHLSRLYGHSSSSGSNRVPDEVDCLDVIEERLAARGWRSREESKALFAEHEARMQEAHKQVLTEPRPTGEQIWEHVFADRNVVAEDLAAPGPAAEDR
ncbi:MAG: thiamine pyrophosphate-dependent dehydrogenase E1 component subunit alpha [Sandaracinaceae bacterium]